MGVTLAPPPDGSVRMGIEVEQDTAQAGIADPAVIAEDKCNLQQWCRFNEAVRFFRKKFSGQWVPKLQEWVGHWWPDLAGSEDCGAAWLRVLELQAQCEGSTQWLWPLEWPVRARAWDRRRGLNKDTR